MIFTLICAFAVLIGVVNAESHTLKFVNNCGKGVPTIVQGGQAVPIESEFTVQGPLQSSIGYLNTGCLLNGEGCVLLEMNLNNPTCPGCGPSVDLSLISPHTFNVPTAFQFYGGSTNAFGTAGSCDGLGAFCADASCSTAFHNPNDNQVQRACQLDDINLLVTFCGSGPSAFLPAVPNSLSNIANAPAANPPASVASTETHAPAPETTTKPATVSSKASTPATTSVAVAPPASDIVSPTSVASITTTSTPASSVPGGSSNSSNPPSRSGTKMCKNKRRRRSTSANSIDFTLKRKRIGAGAHARAQDRARSFAGLARL
ncbi:hypothetical protein SCHPADRAFT_845100 [Schizopora paradoxa]|uniref:Glycopeptide n=1 Tax=Schizopora paradoxa TaxID=27342 RepID=A0A0H2S9G0_9AGAM|nr:hypothetical protein SCHPADRAFT_845100 [Schizopora paradoxa]